MNMQAIQSIAFDLLGSKSSHVFKEKGNKYYHGQRVAVLVLKLRRLILPDDDSHDDILTAAAWMHDVTNGTDNHAVTGAAIAKEALQPHCSPEELSEICEIIRVHDDRKPKGSSFSEYIKLHQDADYLDHFGTFDVWGSFLYAKYHGYTINEASDWLKNGRPKENERFRSELHYEVSRKIFDEKIEFLNSFTERFYVETAGGIWNEERLTR